MYRASEANPDQGRCADKRKVIYAPDGSVLGSMPEVTAGCVCEAWYGKRELIEQEHPPAQPPVEAAPC